MPNMSSHDSVAAQLSRIRDFIRWGASRMHEAGLHFGHGTSDALDEAVALVLHALHLPPDLHSDYFDAVLLPEEKDKVLALLRRRVEERIPAAYLMNRTWFMGLEFYVDSRVLVPRSPLAEGIEQRFSPWVKPDRVQRILDLCTGSGCIGIACAYAFLDADVDMTDISEDALAVAQHNIEAHGLEGRVRAVRSDLFRDLAGQRYDLIVSNPPYVGREELESLPPEYRHEPALGLASGEQGLDAVLEILHQAGDHLTDAGVLVVEVGNTQELLMEALPEAPFTWLEFQRGGQGVFLLTREQLREAGQWLYQEWE